MADLETKHELALETGVQQQTKFQAFMSDVKRDKHSYILVAPYFLLFFSFTVLPVLMSLVLSFTYFNLLEPPNFIGWQNYGRLFLDDDIFLIAIKNTMLFALITGPISYFACFFFAWVINEFNNKLRSILVLVFYAPSISGNVYFIWQIIFWGDRYGWVNAQLIKIGALIEPIEWLKHTDYMLWIVIIVQLWLSLGTGFLAFVAGLQTVDRTLYEAGAMDGISNRWQELWYITLPSMKPMLMFGAVIQITTAFGVAEVSMNIAGYPSVNYAAHTAVVHLLDYGWIRFEMGYASAIATVLFAIMIISNLLIQKLLRKVGE